LPSATASLVLVASAVPATLIPPQPKCQPGLTSKDFYVVIYRGQIPLDKRREASIVK